MATHESAVRWLRQRGYHTLAQVRANPEARRVAEGADVREVDLMPEQVVKGSRKSLKLTWLPVGEDPPRYKRLSLYDEVAQLLRDHPGQWCNLGEAGAGCTSSLRRRGISVAERKNGTAKPIVYARYPEE